MSSADLKHKKRTAALIFLLVFITVASLCVTAWALFFREADVILTPDYAPQEPESNAEPIPGDESKLEAAAGGGAIGLEYNDKVTIDLSEKKASLQFANPHKSTQNMVLQIVIQDEIIVQSGTIKAGHRVKTLDLLEGAERKLTQGIYEAKFVILCYNPENGEKAMVNTEAAITVTVTE